MNCVESNRQHRICPNQIILLQNIGMIIFCFLIIRTQLKKKRHHHKMVKNMGPMGVLFCFALFCFYLYFSDQLYLLQSAHSFRTSPHLIPLVVLQIAIAFPLQGIRRILNLSSYILMIQNLSQSDQNHPNRHIRNGQL